MNAGLLAALAGAAGGAVGAGVVWLVERALGRRPKWSLVIPIVFVVLAVGLVRQLSPATGRMAQLDAVVSVQALKTHYPDDYRRLAVRVDAAGSDGEALAAVAAVLGDVARRQRPKADAETSRELYLVTRGEGRALQPVDPQGCATFLDGRGAPGLAKVMTPALTAQDLAATAKLLVQTATRPAPPVPAMGMDELTKLSLQAVSTLPEAEQDIVARVLRSEKDPATLEESRAMCAFNLALADVLLSQSPQLAGNQVRAMWAMQ